VLAGSSLAVALIFFWSFLLSSSFGWSAVFADVTSGFFGSAALGSANAGVRGPILSGQTQSQALRLSYFIYISTDRAGFRRAGQPALFIAHAAQASEAERAFDINKDLGRAFEAI
jgi:hypothetical protein